MIKKSSKKYIKKSNSSNIDLNHIIGGKDDGKVRMMRVLKYFVNKSSNIYTYKETANDFIGIGWFLTTNEFLMKKCMISERSVRNKLQEFEKSGYIKREVEYFLGADKKRRPYIKIIYCDKLLNILNNKKKLITNKEVKIVDKVVDKFDNFTENGTKVCRHIYIDNTYNIIINNNIFRKVNITKLVDKISQKVLSLIESDEKMRSYNNFCLGDVELTNEICNILRERTGKYYSNSFLNELLSKLSVIKPFHTFRTFVHFLNYFTKIVEYEKKDWRDVNEIKDYKISISGEELEKLYKKNSFIDYLRKKYEELEFEFDIIKIKNLLYKRKEQDKMVQRVKLMFDDSSIDNFKSTSILDAIVSDFYDKFQFRAIQNRISLENVTIEQIRKHLYGNYETDAKEFELLTFSDFTF